MSSTTIQSNEEKIFRSTLSLLGEKVESDSEVILTTDRYDSGDSDKDELSKPGGRYISKEVFGETEVNLWQDVSGGCGGRTWEAAYVMINYILWKYQQGTASFLDGKRILDLGSGTGLVGLAIAKACSLAHMELTDQMAMMSLLQDNIQLNQVGNKVGASILNWGELHDHNVDIVLASDCVYLEVAFQPLVDTLVTLTDNNKDVQIYMSYRKRRKADKRFFTLLKKQFNTIDIMDDPERPIYSRQGLHLYRLERIERKLPSLLL